MRIALVHMRHARSGGTERYLNYLSRYLADREHEVTIVCRSHVEPAHPALRFEVLRDFAIGPAWRFWAFARAVEEHVSKTDYDVVFALGRTWSQDVVRLGGGCHRVLTELVLPSAATPVKRLLGRRRLKHQMALRIEERALAPGAYRRVITNSRMIRREVMREHGVPEDAISVIHNGVDLERFNPAQRRDAGAAVRRELGLAADERVVLYLGSGFARKGLDVLLDAFPRLLQERPGVKLVVVGHDSAQARFAARARERGIGDSVRFLGGRQDPEACYAAADLYVLPTRYDAFANATVEALASGLPVITSPTNGAHELIEEGVQGAVVPAEDALALGEQLVAWTEAERLEQGALRARELAEQHGIESKMQATEELLLQVRQEKLAGLEAARC